jgi:hypothetical protein
MNNNYIPAAQQFACTHGRRGIFLLRLERDPKDNLCYWHMVFAGHPSVCPEHLQEVISSPQGFVDANICRIDAEQQAYALSAAHETWYFKNRKLLRSAS